MLISAGLLVLGGVVNAVGIRRQVSPPGEEVESAASAPVAEPVAGTL
jgi:hypothetical protein